MSAFCSRRSAARIGVLGAIIAATVGVVHAPVVSADPVVIGSAQEATDRLAELGHESATTNEQLLQAEDRLTAARDEQRRTADQVVIDEAAVADAAARIDGMRPEIDRIVAANYQGARTNRLFAVMVSDSPQQLLDQMSVLDVVSHRVTSQLAAFAQASSDAKAARERSLASADAARLAAEGAQHSADELQGKQDQLHSEIAEVIAAYAQLTGDQQAAYAGTLVPPGVDVNAILAELMPGANTSVLQAALTQLGKPYVWGATGPDSFDCSGLVQWAYARVGKQVPRTSGAQAAGGVPVSRENLQPGDIVVFYPGQSHVGIYAGNGNIVHASTFGVPVKVESMDGMPFDSARRY